MAARHEVQNLVRRGNVFYWRSRILRRFGSAGDGHLSLSLRQSDHMKAKYMARRLNTLLDDLKITHGAALTTKEQLEALFRTEVGRMEEHLDNLQFAARRIGSDAVLSARADIEVGWAYRLIELFGTMRRLSFGRDCPGRLVLDRAEIPEHSIAVIAETFRQEQAACRQVHFENALLADMARHHIPDTLINRERATAELMRAKADMLLSAPSRYPELEGQSAPDLLRAGNEGADPRATANSAISADPPSLSDQEHPVAETEPRDEPLAGEDREAKPKLTSPPADSAPVRGVVLPVDQFMDQCEKLIRSKRNWEDKTAQDVRVVVSTFVGILGEHGIASSTQMTQFHLGQLRRHFDEIPTRYGQSARLRKLTTRELRAAAARQLELAKSRVVPPPAIGLGATTIRKHLSHLSEYLKYLRGHGYGIPELSMEGIRPGKPKSGDIRTLTEKPDADRVRPLFRVPILTGCRDAEAQDVSGNQVFHCANYFLPMLLTYLGPRRFEMAGLAVKDIVETPNGWAIHIRPNQFRRIKNTQSVRMLPIPDEVLRLNFLPYLNAVRDLGYQALFPELYHPTLSNDPGDRFYKDFVPIARQSEEIGSGMVSHRVV